MTDDPDKAGRGQSGRWRKGRSGNPAGMAPGTRHRATRAVEALLAGEAEGLTRRAIEAALAGDMMAMKLCLERLAPPPRTRTVALPDLPDLGTPAGLLAASARLIAATASGELSPDEGVALAGLLDRHRQMTETADLAERIAALEQQTPPQGRRP